MSTLVAVALALLAAPAATPAGTAGPQGAARASKTDAPEICPWCRGEPELMRAAGVVSHGPMPIGPAGSDELAQKLSDRPWIFLETAHIRWAFALGETSIERADRKRVAAELDRLRAMLPDVPAAPARLDPWLRLHLLALRAEDVYERFQRRMGVDDRDFPESRPLEGPYMGDGRFLGEKDKFELVIHASRSSHHQFLAGFTGARVTDTLRWHFSPQHKLLASIPAEDPDLREDRWLMAHVAHNLSHLFLCAYKHFSYDPPVWLDEGLAHLMEKEIEPTSNTTDGEEGSYRDGQAPSDWDAAVRKLVGRGKQKSLAELMPLVEFGQLDRDANLCAWSMVRFLAEAHPDAFASLVGAVKGQLDARGYPDGADLAGLQRRKLQELFGWSPLDFDRAWIEWVLAPR